MVIILLPVLILLMFSDNTISDNIYYADLNNNIKENILNSIKWFKIILKNIGIINFLIFLFGLAYFIFLKGMNK